MSRSDSGAIVLARDDDRAVAVAHARAVREDHVVLLDVRVGVQRDRGDLELAVHRPLVQRLDVVQDVLELEPARVDDTRGEAPEHERVVRVGAMSKTNQQGGEPSNVPGTTRR